MERELACEIVKDLLPLYVEGMVSDASKQSIEAHMASCAACSEICQNMKFQLEDDAPPKEVGEVKRFLKKTKRVYLFYGLGALSLLAILICIIVDLAVNKGLTWSLIVTAAVAFADAFLYAVLLCPKNRLLAAMTIISVGTFFLLSVIQLAAYYRLHTGGVWIFRYGFPILLLWLLILWLPTLARILLHWNIWDCIALLCLLAVAGNYATKLITGDYVWADVMQLREFADNALGNLISAVLFAVIGRVKRWRR